MSYLLKSIDKYFFETRHRFLETRMHFKILFIQALKIKKLMRDFKLRIYKLLINVTKTMRSLHYSL